MNPPITPGEILLEEYLTPMGISQNAMARAIAVAPRAINEIVLGHRGVSKRGQASPKGVMCELST